MTAPREGGRQDRDRMRETGAAWSAQDSLKQTERFTELYREEKREEGDRGDQEEKRGSQKGRDQSSQ